MVRKASEVNTGPASSVADTSIGSLKLLGLNNGKQTYYNDTQNTLSWQKTFSEVELHDQSNTYKYKYIYIYVYTDI